MGLDAGYSAVLGVVFSLESVQVADSSGADLGGRARRLVLPNCCRSCWWLELIITAAVEAPEARIYSWMYPLAPLLIGGMVAALLRRWERV